MHTYMPIMHYRVYTGLTGRASPTEILFLWWLPRRALVYPEQEMNVVVALRGNISSGCLPTQQ